MPGPRVQIKPFALHGASDHEYRALNVCFNCRRAEVLPDDPPTPAEELIDQYHHIPSFVEAFAWVAWSHDETAIVAFAQVHFENTDENKHLVEFQIGVLPKYRRQGIGRQLLAKVTNIPRRESRRLMMTRTNERVLAGAEFLRRLGAEKGLESHTNRLALAQLERGLVRRWIERAPERASDFTLDLWTGRYPEDRLVAMARLMEVMNSAPRDGLDLEDTHLTPEQLRQMEESMLAGGSERWTLYASEKSTGKLAGFTEVYWSPNRPTLIQQGNTGVSPEFRDKGLGRWLKAAMLEKIIQGRPAVQFVRSGNADSNAAMLRINHELGFRPYLSQCVWQVKTENVLAYLGKDA